MRRSYLAAAALAIALCGTSVVAGAAADYFLQIKGVEGESSASAAGQTLGVSSFSWGANNAGAASAASGTGSPRTAVRESPTRAGTKAAREAASGMATGRPSPTTATADSVASSAAVSGSAPTEGSTLSVAMPDSGGEAMATLDRMCATGRHIKEAVLRSGDQTYEMKDLVVVSCTTTGAQRLVTFKTGHVTLMK